MKTRKNLKHYAILLLLVLTNAFASSEKNSAQPLKKIDSTREFPSTNEYDDFFIRSLKPGASNDPRNLNYFGENKCKEREVKCYLILSGAGNLLLDQGDEENGLKYAIYGYELIHDSDYCPIAYEIVVINHKLKKLNKIPTSEASSKAQSILYKINHSGGLSNNLKTNSCESLKVASPIYFEIYGDLIKSLSTIAK